VKPLGDWGEGQVQLIEIPSDSETNDNIVVYWRPRQALLPHQAFNYRYRLTWQKDAPGTQGVARIIRSARGQKLFTDHNEMVIDYADTGSGDNLTVDATISSGSIKETIIQPKPSINGTRVFIIFEPGKQAIAELRVMLLRLGKPAGETWLYRWVNGR